jgi:calcium-dependent protein kinase
LLQQKPENLLYSDKSLSANLKVKPLFRNLKLFKDLYLHKFLLSKVIDFGLSRAKRQNSDLDKDELMSTRVGTPYYIAPEVLAKNYTKACDLWSTGVILYILLCGYPPFYGSTEDSIFRRVRRGTFTFPSPEWDTVSDSAKDLVRKLLEVDICKRLSASDALKHEWIKNLGPYKPPSSPITNTTLNVSIVDNMRSFANSRKLRKAALKFIASSLDGPEIEKLNKAFLEIDSDRNGMVNCKELYTALIDLGYEGSLENVRLLLEGIDYDGDGLIDYNEFLAAAVMKQQVLKVCLLFLKQCSLFYKKMTYLFHIIGG